MKKKKTVIIFGATGYIGEKISVELAKYDINLILHGKTKKKLISLDDKIRTLGKKSTLIHCDFSNPDNFKKVAFSISEKYKNIDFIINAIGMIEKLCPLTDLTFEEWDKMININLSSNWKILKNLEPLLMNSVAPKIIFISNTIITKGHPYHHAYSVAKAGLEAMVKIYKKEKMKFKINAELIKLKSLKIGLLKKFHTQEDKNELENLSKELKEIIKKVTNC